jgi:hypothetical protein
MIAAWIGVIAYRLWTRGAAAAAVGLCLVAALVGSLFRPDLDILDTEHAVALGIGIGVALWLPSLGRVQLRGLPALHLLLQAGLLRLGSARRNG